MSERSPVQIRVKPRRRWRRKPRGAAGLGRMALSCLSPPGGAMVDGTAAMDHSQAPRVSINTRRRRPIATPPSTKRARLIIGGAADAPPSTLSCCGGNGGQVSTAAGAESGDQVAGPSNQRTPENGEMANGAKQIAGVGGKKRRRRAPRRKWKPYFKMTNDEKRLQEIREEKRAEQVRAQRFKKGLPVAPYNTTQFLFDDLKQRAGNDQPSNVDEIIENIRRHHRSESYDESGSDGSAAVGSSGGEANGVGGNGSAGAFELFNDKEFDNEYDSAFVERLSAMTKQELIREYLDLEKQFERNRTDLMERDRDLADCQRRLARAEHLLAESRRDVEAPPAVVQATSNNSSAASDTLASDPMDPGASTGSNVVVT